MSEAEVNIRILDANYVPFPTFEAWTARTSVDTVRWERYNRSLKNQSDKLSKAVLDQAIRVATRAAALDTGAIEGLYEVDRGFTFTVAFETAAWEAALAEKGPRVKPLFEAQLHAYDFVLDLATKAEPISEAAIRALHEEVCAAQPTYRVMTSIGPQEQPLPKGQYKLLPNHVRTRKGTNHSYAPVDATPTEMARLTAELRSDAFLAAHPVLQAAYAHYSLVVIHPFADGNGRVARALASAFTYRAISLPIVILSEQRDAYLTSLESSDAGDNQAFVDFMLASSLDTIGLVSESLRSAMVPRLEESLAAIDALYLTRGGYTHEQIDQLGSKLFDAFQHLITQAISKVGMPNVTFRTERTFVKYNETSGFRLPLHGGQLMNVVLTAKRPFQTTIYKSFGLMLPRDAAGDDDVQIVRVINQVPSDGFVARIDQLSPSISGALQVRLNMFADRVVSELFAELRAETEKTAHKNTGA